MASTAELEPLDTWKCVSSSRKEAIKFSQYCPDRPCVQVQVPWDAVKVHRVEFRTLSHDQGWSNTATENPSLRGTYSASFSGFNAAICSIDGRERRARKPVQKNREALAEPFPHTNTWDERHGDEELSAWLGEIRPGDYVQLIPWAYHLCWLNYIYEAEVTVHFTESVTGSQRAITVAEEVPLTSAAKGIYRPLDRETREIRVLKLHPGSEQDVIECQIEHVSLPDPERLQYECLSYCWGDSTITKQISVNAAEPVAVNDGAHLLSVTANLHAALKRLRPKSSPSRILWADAVCINQPDIEERNSQIALMTEIYASASEVFVFLASPRSLAIDGLRIAQSVVEGYISRYPAHGAKTLNEEHPELDVRANYDVVQNNNFFDNEWFRRTWVLQEVYFAKTATVIYGPLELPWSFVLQYNRCVNRNLREITRSAPYMFPTMPGLFSSLFQPPTLEVLSSPKDSEHAIGRNGTLFGILDVFLKGLDLRASDPRDKLFALLQFGRDVRGDVLYDSDSILLLPDYSKPMWQVFADFTRWWIVKHESLRILAAVHVSVGRTWQELFDTYDSSLDPTRPTWSLWHDGRSSWARKSLGLPLDTEYNAAGDTKPNRDLILSNPRSAYLHISQATTSPQ